MFNEDESLHELPEGSAALILHADGDLMAIIPKMDDDEAIVPQHVMLMSAFMRIAGDATLTQKTIAEFVAASRTDPMVIN